MINFKIVFNVIGILSIIIGIFILSISPYSFYISDGSFLSLIFSGLIPIVIGLITWKLTKVKNKSNKIGKREGYLIVSLGWIFMSLFCMLPYIFSGTLTSITNAYFESISGLTTTGASVINDIEAVSKSILLWRSLTQWIGGMGIIVLTIAIFPLLGIGGVELFVAEAPGPTSDKLHPRIQETAKRLWFIYLGLTFILIILLKLFGMDFYDAINHSLTTMSTGGFSTKNSSATNFLPRIQYLLIIFMFIAGTNYTVLYFVFIGKFKKVWKSDEFKAYIMIVLTLSIIISIIVFSSTNLSFEKSFRDVSFQIISIITTTGFVSADYTSWHPMVTMVFFLLLFLGACAGSTSGGFKIIRHIVIQKNTFLEFKKLIHPRALIRVKVDKKTVSQEVMNRVLAFLQVYLIIFVCGSILMGFILSNFEQPFLTAIGSVATALGNVGPAIGQVGPVNNFAEIPVLGKWLLSFLMILGRLELFTVLIIFSPYFWKTN